MLPHLPIGTVSVEGLEPVGQVVKLEILLIVVVFICFTTGSCECIYRCGN